MANPSLASSFFEAEKPCNGLLSLTWLQDGKSSSAKQCKLAQPAIHGCHQRRAGGSEFNTSARFRCIQHLPKHGDCALCATKKATLQQEASGPPQSSCESASKLKGCSGLCTALIVMSCQCIVLERTCCMCLGRTQAGHSSGLANWAILLKPWCLIARLIERAALVMVAVVVSLNEAKVSTLVAETQRKTSCGGIAHACVPTRPL